MEQEGSLLALHQSDLRQRAILERYTQLEQTKKEELKQNRTEQCEILKELRLQYPHVWVIHGKADHFQTGPHGCFSTLENAMAVLCKRGEQQGEIHYEAVRVSSATNTCAGSFLMLDKDVDYFYYK